MQQPVNNQPHRIHSIDLLRGAIMLIMALDHVREYFHAYAFLDQPTNMATTTPALFFTRWITHFCAPVFLFLSGVSAYISGQRKTKNEQSIFLIKRGLWLIVAEIVIMNLIETFNPLYNMLLLAVLWAIGWSMVILGLLIRTSYKWIIITGVIIVASHNITDYIHLPTEGANAAWWQILLTTKGSVFNIGNNRLALIPYAILPWTGIMLLGYAAGFLYKSEFDPGQRRKLLIQIGASLVLLFIVLRLINLYGDPSPWTVQKNGFFTFLSFLNVTKYPVSLQFTCLTIGPALILLALTEKINNRFSKFTLIYGKVPFFYFVIHFLLIHILCVAAFFATGHTIDQAADPASPFLFRPASFGFALPIVYVVWLLVVLLMYFPCRWFSNYKQYHKQWWLSYA